MAIKKTAFILRAMSVAELKRGDFDQNGAARYNREQTTCNGAVTILQYGLIAEGILHDKPDGAYGADTEQAVKALFPNSNGVFNVAQAINPVVGESEQAEPMSEKFIDGIPFFSQWDSRWAGETLGENRTFKQAGCTVVCLTMLANDLIQVAGVTDIITPIDLDRELDQRNGYLVDDVRWNVFGEIMREGFQVDVMYDRLDGLPENDPGYLERYVELIDSGHPVLLRVTYGSGAVHFVLGIGYKTTGSKIIPYFHDPALSEENNGYNGDTLNNMDNNRKGYRLSRLDYYT